MIMKHFKLFICLFLLAIFLCSCTSYVYLEQTPEHCYPGTDIYTFDYICEDASEYSATGDTYRYSANAVYRKWARYTDYLSEREDTKCLESSLFGFRAVYETPYGEITVFVSDAFGNNIELSGTGALNLDKSGMLSVIISR